MQFCVAQFWIFLWSTGFTRSHIGQWGIVSVWRICSSVRISQLLTNTSWRKLGIWGSRVSFATNKVGSTFVWPVATLARVLHTMMQYIYNTYYSTICQSSKKQCISFKNLKVEQLCFMFNNFTCWCQWIPEYWFSLHFMSTETGGNY